MQATKSRLARLGVWWRQLLGHGLFAYSRLVMLTGRYRVEGWEHMHAAQESGRPILWSLWHGQMMPFVVFADRFLERANFVAVIVGDERGDTLGAYGSHFGSTPYRVDMGGNPVAAGRAVLRVIEGLQGGRMSMLAPDGPDGPPYVPKPGVTFLARKAEAVILPIGLWSRQAIRLPRWDHYQVPVPLGRIHITIGEPIYAERKSDDAALQETLSAALHKRRTRAQVMTGIKPWR
ncbi:MAG: hypothetical protein RRC07_01040 [Anaerolineae bacterium]|nr:hypothetical protein [Anaerolineae bacterium]